MSQANVDSCGGFKFSAHTLGTHLEERQGIPAEAIEAVDARLSLRWATARQRAQEDQLLALRLARKV